MWWNSKWDQRERFTSPEAKIEMAFLTIIIALIRFSRMMILHAFDGGNYSYFDYYLDDLAEDVSNNYVITEGSNIPVTEGLKSMLMNCPQNELPQEHMMLVYCAPPYVTIPKCCLKGFNVNLRERYCTNDRAKNLTEEDIDIYEHTGKDSFERVEEFKLVPLEHQIMDRKVINVKYSNFKMLKDGRLRYRSRTYERQNFCLDFSIDYCLGSHTESLRAFIYDPTIDDKTASTIFGAARDDTDSMTIKEVGYPVSIFFLLVTLFLFLHDKDLKKASIKILLRILSRVFQDVS